MKAVMMLADPSQIFSQEALNKLRSPEKLDTMLPITMPVGWISIAAIGVFLFSVVLWSVFGAFTVTADGMGMIMDAAGVVNVAHISGGKVERVYIREGQKIHKGDLIAYFEQAEQSADVKMGQYSLGLATNDRDAMNKAYQYGAKKEQKNVAEYVYSEYDGIVDSIFVEKGSVVSSGTPVCTIRVDSGRDEFEGIFYIPVDKGKRVEPGMTIQLAPNGVDITQTGSLIGVVRSVSQYPVSAQYLRLNLGNDQLAQWIQTSQSSALMEIRFNLVKDKDSESGYLWTSIIGEHKPITAGSFCTGSIVIERKPPIEKVFYKLSQWLRSR